MKKRIVKGFTLTELIVVLAIFSIILIAAMSFLNPVSKIMISTQVQEESSSAANGISSFLTGQLAASEYLHVSNDYPCDADGNVNFTTVDNAVLSYANNYYSGIVRAECNPASPNYASGAIHVLLVDKATGLISTIDYPSVSFGTDGNAPSDIGCSLGAGRTYTKYAVNAAYYDKYDIQISHGTRATEAEFADNISLADNFNSDGANMSILIRPKSNANASWVQDYFYIHHCSFTLVNVAASATTSKHYYTAREIAPVNPGDPTTYGFVDVTDSSSPVSHDVRQVDYTITGNDRGYMFIYSYGIEIDTARV